MVDKEAQRRNKMKQYTEERLSLKRSTKSVGSYKGAGESVGMGTLASAVVHKEMPFPPLSNDRFLGILSIKFWTHLCDISSHFLNTAPQ